MAPRGIHALARWQRWALVAIIVAAVAVTEQRLLFLVGGVAAWRAFQQQVGPGNNQVLATFAVLVVVLALLAKGVG